MTANTRHAAPLGALFLALAATGSARASDQRPLPTPRAGDVAPQAVPTPRVLVERFHLFPELDVPPPVELEPLDGNERLFHRPGDPDSLFTLGSPTPQGELRLQAAFEVNDVVLRAIAPDLRVAPADTRPRAAGDYRALDATGRPYQLRLGARLVW